MIHLNTDDFLEANISQHQCGDDSKKGDIPVLANVTIMQAYGVTLGHYIDSVI
jgi:hypothetical protein